MSLKPPGPAGNRLWGEGSENHLLRNLGSMTEILSTLGTQEQRVLSVNPKSHQIFQQSLHGEAPGWPCGDPNTKDLLTKSNKRTSDFGRRYCILHQQWALTSNETWLKTLPLRHSGEERRCNSQCTLCTSLIWNHALPSQKDTMKFNFLKKVTQLSGPYCHPHCWGKWRENKDRGLAGSCLTDPDYHHWHCTTMHKAWKARALPKAREQICIFPRWPWKNTNQESGSLRLLHKPEAVQHMKGCAFSCRAASSTGQESQGGCHSMGNMKPCAGQVLCKPSENANEFNTVHLHGS